MNDFSQRLAKLSPEKLQLLERRLGNSQEIAEPIAIVGMACRFPGAPTLDAYWKVISEGVNAIDVIRPDRWNIDDLYDPTGELPGKMSVRHAGMIEDVDKFDAMFFGIAPREAARMDPQQRLLLEVAWEAFEVAGLAPEQMCGLATGVFVGIGANDYSKVYTQYENFYSYIDAHVGTGNALSIAANRLSYLFDLRGPSIAVDTACSSSTLAVHLAVQSLRNRECNAALAGGVNLILTPETTIAFSKAHMLSTDGHCRPFDAGANGYVRGEGCAMIVLKRLTDALKDRDNVLAVIRATAVNQDGRTSGITAPNARSQQAVIRAALQQARWMPDRVEYIEAHGTGTPLGDPIEMEALTRVFRRNRPDDATCYVSSVKANIGHTETVSGVAGIIKIALMMQHDVVPAQLHFQQLNPHISLEGTRLAIPDKTMPWNRHGTPRAAGASSFGFGGTNTHVLLEDATLSPTPAIERDRPLHLLSLSAKTDTALNTLAQRYATYLAEHPDASLADVCHTANVGRSHFNHRLAVTAADTQELRDKLANLHEKKKPAGVWRRQCKTASTLKVAFFFTGQGSQYVQMGRALYETQPTFSRALDKCDEILRPLLPKPLLSVLYPEAGEPSLLDETVYTQPALFAVEYALSALWRSWGIEPALVLGHSVGEYVAACIAGVFSLEDGLTLIAHRARLMQQLPRDGMMAVIFASASRVEPALAEFSDRVSVAALNGPDNTVISGDEAAIRELLERFALEDIRTQALAVSHAFHSPLMEPMLDEFESLASEVEYSSPALPLVSNLSGTVMNNGAPSADYWRRHVRSPVRFATSVEQLAPHEISVVLEIGPTSSLLGMARRC
ncbi:MAG TPA: type I polyketide synthase, partial [Pirellulales bacterium]|nr:type I polyketide synthase [Pirellulales bacterium]